jgi:hypothetical protein
MLFIAPVTPALEQSLKAGYILQTTDSLDGMNSVILSNGNEDIAFLNDDGHATDSSHRPFAASRFAAPQHRACTASWSCYQHQWNRKLGLSLGTQERWRN